MITVVDGYNLLFARVKGSIDAGTAERARDDLVRLLNRYAESTRTGVIVVFDSTESVRAPQRQRQGLVTIIYAREVGKADAEILRIVRAYKNPAELRVVTSDASVARQCKQAHADVISSRDFLDLLGETIEAPGGRDEPREEPDIKYQPPSAEEVQYWLEQFSTAAPKKKRRR